MNCPDCGTPMHLVNGEEVPWTVYRCLICRPEASAPAPVGGLEIADRLGVKRETVAMWKQRGLLPPARWTVSGEDAWDWSTIREWAIKTGRMTPDSPTETDSGSRSNELAGAGSGKAPEPPEATE